MQTCANALRAGDTLTINNTPADTAGSQLTSRVDGTQLSPITVRGKTGQFPEIESTAADTALITHNWWIIENLDVRCSSATSSHLPFTMTGSPSPGIIRNCKISSSGASTHPITGTGSIYIFGCEFTGGSASGSAVRSNGYVQIQDSYIHNMTGNGIENASLNTWSVFNVLVERCGGRGVYCSASTGSVYVYSSTIYRCDNSGIETTGAGAQIFNTVVKDCGNAAGEYNVEIGTAAYLALGHNNCFSVAGSRGGSNLSNYTLTATDITGDPAFIDPDNGTAALRNFGLSDDSPCRATGFPGAFQGSTGTVGYLDMGAVQREEPDVFKSVYFSVFNTKLSGTREQAFLPGDTVTVGLTINASASLSAPTLLVEVRDQATDVVVETVYSQVTSLSTGANVIAGLTYTTAQMGEFYVRVTITDSELGHNPTKAETQFLVGTSRTGQGSGSSSPNAPFGRRR